MSKKIVGYTTGVFDMFHVGHLNIIKKSKNYCDYLIVGVSTDELVKKYKKKKPIIPFEHRIEIISSIKYVDEVIPVIHRDKIQSFIDVGYNVLFVGDDWKGDPVFDKLEKHLLNYGSKIEYFTYTKNVSSTKFSELLSAISNNNID
jgi:glycerol-3-phosphate cytidylyltransferase